jgi:NADH-quinone oxidoreductase subunit A
VSDFLRSYLTVAIFGGVAVVLLGGLLGLGSLIRPSRPQAGKYLNYESGVDPVGSGWAQSQVRYYIFALLFVMFDVEAVFIFPFATRIEAYGWFGVWEMGAFIVILALGLVYAWRKGVLRWI